MTTNRYRWRKPFDSSDRVKLLDSALNRVVAAIFRAGREWSCKRWTICVVDGAPPAEWICGTLVPAKIKVLDGLPDE